MLHPPADPAPQMPMTERASAVLPAGGFGNFDPGVVIARGLAGRVWDTDGREYVDYLIGSGPMLVGHAHPEVNAVVMDQLANGTTFFASNPHGIELAEVICDAVACAEQVRYVSTGTEADMYAIRLARAYTGREKIIKFEGGYHGMSDIGQMSLAPEHLANFPQPVPDSAGICADVRDSVLVAPFNDADFVRRLMDEYAGEIAAVIVEPLQRLIPPQPGFLVALREETAKRGIVLIFDEVVTGFRLAYGGAQEAYGVVPDLCTLGKVIGGGFPLAAIAGGKDIMAHFDKAIVGSDRFLMQIGTLSGNPVAAVAGLKTLEILKRPGSYDRIMHNGTAIMDAIRTACARHGIPVQIVGEPVMFDAVFTDQPVTDYRGMMRGDPDRAARFNAVLREHGILKPPSKFYISMAHDDADIAQTVAAVDAAAEVIAG
ncbi:MAG: aminotransferase class III-fold pyridoxal phosphate-dependent enzyme [Pseudomonadota bacterium]